MIDLSTGLIKLYTENKNAVGTHTATVSIGLVDYVGVVLTTTHFTIQIGHCIVKSFAMSPLTPIYDYYYTVTEPTLTWSIDSNTVTT